MRTETLLIGALSLILAAYLTQASAQPVTPDADIEKPITTQAHAEVDYRVAVLANYGVAKSIDRWQPLMDYLTQKVANAHFDVVPLDFNNMNKKLISGDIQFVVTNPGHYSNMSDDYPISWLATMKSNQHHGSTFAIGAAIIVRNESHLFTIEDLAGHSVVASDPNALGGYQAAIGLIHSMGYSTHSFFSKLTFLGFPLEPLIYQVRDGTADIAITPFCTLEQMVAEGYIN